mgnify:CR=1 FL=1
MAKDRPWKLQLNKIKFMINSQAKVIKCTFDTNTTHYDKYHHNDEINLENQVHKLKSI